MEISSTLITSGLFFCLFFHIEADSPPASTEYCLMEKFQVSCPDDHVILMTKAHYGRMQLGRCLTRDYYVGCSVNVLTHLDARCSGRRQCVVDIPDPTLQAVQPCPKDLVAYLQADYQCLQVFFACESMEPTILTSETGYITNVKDSEQAVSGTCPVTVRAKPGQVISVTLIDLTLEANRETWAGESSALCQIYATITETLDKTETDTIVCSKNEREVPVYISKSNEIQITMATELGSNQGLRFFLRYDAVGCPDPVVPAHAYLRRDGEKADVTCNFTVKSWHLVCKGTSWVGHVDDCSHELPAEGNLEAVDWEESTFEFPTGVLVAVVIGLALGIFLGLLLLFVLYKIRKRSQAKRRQTLVRDPNALLQVKSRATSYRGESGEFVICEADFEAKKDFQMSLLDNRDHVYESTTQQQMMSCQPRIIGALPSGYLTSGDQSRMRIQSSLDGDNRRCTCDLSDPDILEPC